MTNYIKILFRKCRKPITYQERHLEENRIIKERIISEGGTVGENVDFYDVKMDMTNAFLYHIGSNATLTNCRILNHDASMQKAIGMTKIGKIHIGDNVFVGADAILLPNISIGNNVIVGAGAVVSRNIPDNCVVVGNPCRIVSTYTEFCEKNINTCKQSVTINKGSEASQEQRNKIVADGIAFFK